MLRRKTFGVIRHFPRAYLGTYHFEGFSNPDYAMAQATEKQHRQFAALFLNAGERSGWDKDKTQLILDLPPAEFNAWITAHINGYEVPALPEPVKVVVEPPTGPLVLPATFNPSTFVGSGWTIWKGPAKGDGLKGDEEQDKRSLALKEVDFRGMTKEANFLTGLEGSETVVTSEVKRARLIAKAIQADARIGQALFEEEGQKTLRWLDTLGITWFELLGTTLRRSDGRRGALYLDRQGGGSWGWSYSWLDYDRSAYSPALSLASKP